VPEHGRAALVIESWMFKYGVSRKRWRWCLAASVAIGLCPARATAQDATEPALKSALIFNFAKFTSWPDEALPSNAAFVACVVGSREVGQALERAVKDRLLAGHRVEVVSRDGVDPQQTYKRCHLLYVTSTDLKQVARILSEVRGAPVLTIVDTDDGSGGLGIAQLFVENGRIRFDVDHALAKQGRLLLSSRLLSLASRVRENVAVSR
jgi:hypothetical protein